MKNMASSSNITAHYRFCTDYGALNLQLSSPSWPALKQSLDTTYKSNIFPPSIIILVTV